MQDTDPGRPYLLDRRLLLFTGKGGVGKSSLVAGLAVAAARAGRRPLVVELGHRASMEAVFGVEDIGSEPQLVSPGVFAVNLDLESSLRFYFTEHVPIKRAGEAIANNATLQKFFKAAPAVSEIATLNRLRALVDERQGERRRWDPVIVDLDATGHALMLFNLPRVMDDLVGRGPLRPLIDGFVRLFRDPKQTLLNLVTLPRELPMQETRELYERLQREHDIPLGMTIVNQMPEEPLNTAQRGLLELAIAKSETVSEELRAELIRMQAQCEQYEIAMRLSRELREHLDVPVVDLPRMATQDMRNVEQLQSLGERLLQVEVASS